MIHPIKAVRARIQNYNLKNFCRTKYYKDMSRFHNIHSGKSCFVIGNGPSLTAEDLTVLYKNKIDTFAVNRIFRIFCKTPWRPTYYVNTDHVMIRDILDDVNSLEVKDKFIPLQSKYYHGIDVNGAHFFYCNYDREKDGEDGFSLDCSSQVNDRGTVTIACIQLAIHMGYRKIYLLGVDHNFDKVITENGEVIIDPGVKNYFCEGYDDDVSAEVVHDLGTTTRSYMDVRRFCDKYGVKIYNASRQTKLCAFERVDFDMLFEKTV